MAHQAQQERFPRNTTGSDTFYSLFPSPATRFHELGMLISSNLPYALGIHLCSHGTQIHLNFEPADAISLHSFLQQHMLEVHNLQCKIYSFDWFKFIYHHFHLMPLQSLYLELKFQQPLSVPFMIWKPHPSAFSPKWINLNLLRPSSNTASPTLPF